VSGTSESKFPGPEVGFTTLIDLCLEEEDQSLDTFPLRPSSAGKCRRALACELYNYQGRGSLPPEKKDPSTKRLLDLGSKVEYQAIQYFHKIAKRNPDYKITYKQQVLLFFKLKPANANDKNPPLIKGSLDLAVENRREGWTAFGDVKSAKDKFSYIFATKWDETADKLTNMKSVNRLDEMTWTVDDLPAFIDELDDPFFADNFLQLNSYCSTEFAKTINVPFGFIYRVNKNDSRHIEVRFKPSDALFKEFEDKCNYVYQLVMNGTLEDIRSMGCDFPLGSIKNAFCACHHMLSEDPEAARKAYFATFPPKKWPTDTRKLSEGNLIEKLFAEFEAANQQADQAAKIEMGLVDLLMKERVDKVRLENGHVYEVKNYKTGGVGGGPRTALKRGKL